MHVTHKGSAESVIHVETPVLYFFALKHTNLSVRPVRAEETAWEHRKPVETKIDFLKLYVHGAHRIHLIRRFHHVIKNEHPLPIYFIRWRWSKSNKKFNPVNWSCCFFLGKQGLSNNDLITKTTTKASVSQSPGNRAFGQHKKDALFFLTKRNFSHCCTAKTDKWESKKNKNRKARKQTQERKNTIKMPRKAESYLMSPVPLFHIRGRPFRSPEQSSLKLIDKSPRDPLPPGRRCQDRSCQWRQAFCLPLRNVEIHTNGSAHKKK